MKQEKGITNYIDRDDKHYYQSLIEAFDIEKLKESATQVTRDGKKEKMIRIDFCGSIASTLLQPSAKNFDQQRLYEQILNLFENLETITKDDFFFRVRFLFAYPYSDFSFAKIEAEKSHFRPTINEPLLELDAVKLFFHSNEDFFGSDHYIKQRDSLHQIQRWYNKYCRRNYRIEFLNIRFTCMPVNLRLISINNMYFIEPYLYAKQSTAEKQLSKAAIVRVGRNLKNITEVLDDHFRYIWTHPTTLLFEDATNYKLDKNDYLENLYEFKQPQPNFLGYQSQQVQGNFQR